jgi:predicted DCC family thiol-disulfide oxidoreductase YuxK
MLRKKAIIFFDGYCHLCNGAVQFIISRDTGKYFTYAPLQGPTAQEELSEIFKMKELPDSLILVEDGKLHVESTAALKIAGKLRFPWNLLHTFIIIPKIIRDPLYRFVARRRYKWFGKREHCAMPPDGWKERFLP